MGGKIEESMEMLFRAKWNLPRAAEYCGLSQEDCMNLFRKFCEDTPPDYEGYISS